MNDRIASGEEALWLRFTTSSPPNCRCRQSLNTAFVTGPWNPTIITAPISSSSVSPAGLGKADGPGGGACTAALELEHATMHAATARNTAMRRTTNLLTPT